MARIPPRVRKTIQAAADLQGTKLNQFVVQLWMFATPVIYPLSKIPPRYEWLTWLNPMSAVVESLQPGSGQVSPPTFAS